MTGAVVLQRQGKDLLKHRTSYTLQLPVGWLMAKLVAGRLNISFSASFTFKYQSWGVSEPLQLVRQWLPI